VSWSGILDLIAAELGPIAAARIEQLVRDRYAGERIYITARRPVDPADIAAAAPGRPREAARRLGIHPSTAYRALRRARDIR
jgi:transcriptional regulator of acetoin/glycerol metabolism